ncbi:MAG: hypothetical protein SNJ75_09835, partial [Gemmataceae bacterium]
MRSWKHTGVLAACLTSWASAWGQTLATSAPTAPTKSTWIFLSQRKEAGKPSEPSKVTEAAPTSSVVPPAALPVIHTSRTAAASASTVASTPAPVSRIWTLPSSAAEPTASKGDPQPSSEDELNRPGQLVSQLRADELAARKRQADIRYLGGV